MIREKQFLSPFFCVPEGVNPSAHVRGWSGDRVRCHYCGRMTIPGSEHQHRVEKRIIRTVDHARARAHGGTNASCVIACSKCNSVKSDAPYEVFCAWVKIPGVDPWHPGQGPVSWRRFVHDCTLAGLEAARQLSVWTREEAEEAARQAQEPDPVMEAFERFKRSRAA